MEEIIRRRYPNSLPALIYAAASAPGHAQPIKEDTPKKQSPSYAFLENRVKKLENELEEKDEEASKRIRVIEQKYNAMKFGYEERMKELEKELDLAAGRLKDASHAHAHALEKELSSNQRLVKERRTEVQVLQDALAKAGAAEPVRSPKARKKLLEEEKHHRYHGELHSQLEAMQEKLQKRNTEIEELRQTCVRLQREREQMLVCVDKRAGQSPEGVPPEGAIAQENSTLKEKLSHLALEIEQQRVRYQASRSETERALRQAREEAAEMRENLRAQYKRDVDQVKAGFAVSHSTSKMAELQSKIAAQEVVIQRLKENMRESACNTATLTAAQVSWTSGFRHPFGKYVNVTFV